MKNFTVLPPGARFVAGNMISGVKDGHDCFMKWNEFVLSLQKDALRFPVGGSGFDGEADGYAASVHRVGNLVKTEVYMDIDGLVSINSDNDIIGANDAANCWFAHITDAVNGSIYKARMRCLEVPTGGGPDIAIWEAVEATGVENASITGLDETELLQSQGDSTAWEIDDDIKFATLPSADRYLYMVVDGTGTDGTFTAGIFFMELWGYIS